MVAAWGGSGEEWSNSWIAARCGSAAGPHHSLVDCTALGLPPHLGAHAAGGPSAGAPVSTTVYNAGMPVGAKPCTALPPACPFPPTPAGLTKQQLSQLVYQTVDANGMTDHVHIRLMVRGLRWRWLVQSRWEHRRSTAAPPTCLPACVPPPSQVTRGLKSTPYQHPAATIGQPTIVVIPEYKEAAAGPKVGGWVVEVVAGEQASWVGEGPPAALRQCTRCGPLCRSSRSVAAPPAWPPLTMPNRVHPPDLTGGGTLIQALHVLVRSTRRPPSAPQCVPAHLVCVQEEGICLFTVHVRRGAPDVQDPGWNSHSKLNCIAACIQVWLSLWQVTVAAHLSPTRLWLWLIVFAVHVPPCTAAAAPSQGWGCSRCSSQLSREGRQGGIG